MEPKSHDTDDPTAIKHSVLSLLRLTIGNTESGKPTDEEIELVGKIYTLRNSMKEHMGDTDTKMIVALVAATQLLEDVLCHYESDMPDVLTAIICKLAHHGTQHMDLQDNPLQQAAFIGTVH